MSIAEYVEELFQNKNELLDEETYSKYEQQAKIFEELVEKNIIKKRGNQLYNTVYDAPHLYFSKQ